MKKKNLYPSVKAIQKVCICSRQSATVDCGTQLTCARHGACHQSLHQLELQQLSVLCSVRDGSCVPVHTTRAAPARSDVDTWVETSVVLVCVSIMWRQVRSACEAEVLTATLQVRHPS